MPEVTYDTPDRLPWYLRDLPNMNILNLQEILEDSSVHISIRNYCALLIEGVKKENTHQVYCSTGCFFFGASNFMIADLFQMQQGFEDEYSEWLVSKDLHVVNKLRNLTLLAFLLARGEGVPDLSPVVLMEALPNLCKLIQAESKFRKGISKSIPEYRKYFVLNNTSNKPSGDKIISS